MLVRVSGRLTTTHMATSMDHVLSISSALGMALGGAEMLVILCLLAVPVAIVVIVLVVVKASRSRDTSPPPGIQVTTEARLLEIDSMLAAGTITESEHAEQRKRILDSL